ncbi:unnamed protein product [Adineta steineri]|uniref:Uncharacterized protein n=1 Tax=Adineta steineri TaxID=433720 RepID=A0A818TED8_9BILA|nr:unnamed protein product [Adineta steineri]
MSSTKVYKTDRTRQVIFTDQKLERSSSPKSTESGILPKSILVKRTDTPPFSQKNCRPSSKIQSKRLSIKPDDASTEIKQSTNDNNSTPEKIVVQPSVSKTIENDSKLNTQQSISNENESLNSTELGTIDTNSDTIGKIYSQKNKSGKHKENQETFDLLDKIKHSATAEIIGPMPLSQQACRFELPFDLKLLETLTPLEYLSKYCHLSSRRQYQFKRVFNKYRNQKHKFNSSNLFLSLVDLHQENFTHTKFDYLCELINLDEQEHEFTFNTYSGILAFCERMLYNLSPSHKNYIDDRLTKDTIEKCDFENLGRKLDGLIISDTMKKLLYTL